jgi:hypothetical protein
VAKIRGSGITEAAAKTSALIDLVEPLAALARNQEILDKPTNSMFGASDLAERLAARNADTLVVTRRGRLRVGNRARRPAIK